MLLYLGVGSDVASQREAGGVGLLAARYFASIWSIQFSVVLTRRMHS